MHELLQSPLGVVLAAATASAAYGMTDFFGGYATRSCPVDVTVLVSQLTTFPLVLLAAIAGASRPDAQAITYGAVSGVCVALALRLLFRALAAGPMTVVAPMSAILSAVVPIVGGLMIGQRLSPEAIVGGSAALVAITLLSGAGPGARPTARGFVAAAGAGLLFGFANTILGRTSATTGLWPVVTATAVICLAIVVAVLRLPRNAEMLPATAERALALAVLAGVTQAVGGIATLFAVRGNLIIAGPLLSLNPASTVLLAVVVTRERVSVPRAFGLVTAGIAVIALART